MEIMKLIRQKGGTDKIMDDIRKSSIYCSGILMPDTSGIKASDGIPASVIYPIFQSPLISSEFTAIKQYSGDESTFDDLSDMLMQIAVIEMSHFDFFGDAIDRLGGDKNQPWDNSNIRLLKTRKEILSWNIDGEIASRQAYNALAVRLREFPDSQTRRILLSAVSIATEDEMIHERALRARFDSL